MNKNRALNTSFLLVLGAILILGCTKDDDTDPQEETLPQEKADAFYTNAVTDAKASDLLGYWSFYDVEFQGRKKAIPVNYESCDRDYFSFGSAERYKEYITTDSGCSITEFEAKWTVQNGIIYISSFTADDEELVILELTDKRLTIRTRLDTDEDGEMEVFALTALKYEPKDRNTSTDSFTVVQEEPLNDKIQFSWEPYDGQNTFVRYEIYRSALGCDLSIAQLIASFTDANQTQYVDEDPPIAQQLCYLLKIYTDKGLAGESGFRDVITENLDVLPVEMLEPTVRENSIQLNWNASKSPYFSHYEIGVQNYENGTGGGYQSEPLTIIHNIETTTFTDAAPPYFKDPIYTIKVYDIFGNVNYEYSNTVQSSKMANFKRPEVLEFHTLSSSTLDPESSVIYLFGEYQEFNQFAIQRFNYAIKKVEATAINANLSGISSEIRVVSSSNGKEVVVPQFGALQVYDAQNLNYKYKLSVAPTFSIEDFSYLGNNLWAVLDDDEVSIYRRENGNFESISNNTHYDSPNPNGFPQKLISLSDNRLLIARNGASNCVLFTVAPNGKLTQKTTVAISLNSDNRTRAIYNAAQNYIVDYASNRIYNANDFSLLRSFEAPYFPSGISMDGNRIFGVNNDPDWDIQEGSLHEKKAYALDLASKNVTELQAIGYPHRVFENYLGQTLSISSGLKRQNLYSSSPKADILIEIIQP